MLGYHAVQARGGVSPAALAAWCMEEPLVRAYLKQLQSAIAREFLWWLE